MLENFVPTPDYLTPSTSSPFAAVVVSILTIAALLWTLAPRVTSHPFFRTRNYGIAAAFFVLALSASDSFAGDRFTLDSYSTAVEKCTAQRSTWNQPCAVIGDVCPLRQNSGTCSESARGQFLSADGINTGWITSSVQYDYCSDAFPTWNGSACVKDDPCKNKGGQSVDDGSLDFGDGSNKKLSMTFPRRDDDDYVGQTFCSGGCLAAVDKEVGSSGGYFDGKYVGQFSAKFSGQSCAPSVPQVTPKTTPALIPKTTPEYDCVSKGMGYGYVNETVKCVNPSETKAVEKKASETTKADGSKTKETRSDNTVCSNGVCITTTTTITTEYNSSGTQTGTSTKTESTSKPDPNSGLGTGGAGASKEGMSCGGPGQPTCSVKVDETGTPSDSPAMAAQKQAFDAALDDVKGKFAEVSGAKTWGITWGYTPPSGTCSPLQFGAGRFVTSLDVCKPLGYVRDLWGYVIYVMTGLYIWRSARDAISSGG